MKKKKKMNRSAIKISYRVESFAEKKSSVSRTSNKKLTPNDKVKPRDNCTFNRMSQQSHDRLLPFYYSSVPRQFYRTSIRRLVSFRSFWVRPLRNERKTPFSFLLSLFSLLSLALSLSHGHGRASSASLSLRVVFSRARDCSSTINVNNRCISWRFASFFTVRFILHRISLSKNG